MARHSCHHPTSLNRTQVETSDNDSEEDEESNIGTPADPIQDPLKWLDNGPPDLSGFENRFFDLTTQFEIGRYIDVLAESVSDKQKTMEGEGTHRRSHNKGQENVEIGRAHV